MSDEYQPKKSALLNELLGQMIEMEAAEVFRTDGKSTLSKMSVLADEFRKDSRELLCLLTLGDKETLRTVALRTAALALFISLQSEVEVLENGP